MKNKCLHYVCCLVICLCFPWLSSGAQKDRPPYAIKASKILTITKGVIQNGIVLVKNGKIEKVGKDIAIPAGYTVIDASQRWLLPGFVDIHSHTGGEGYGDINDMVFSLNPGLRILDTIALNTPGLKRAVAAGVTTINHIPGSGSNNGGTGIIMKTAGDDLDEVVLRFPGVLKISQAGNPERRWSGEIGTGRMGMTWHLRELMHQIKAYHDEWEAYESGASKEKPKKNVKFEYIKEVYDGTLPVFVHCCWLQPVQTVFRMYHDELGMENSVITPGEFGGYQNAPAVSTRKVHYDCGPRLYDFWYDSFRGLITEYAKAGVKNISINTDAVGTGEEKLFLQAAMAVRLGIDDKMALEGITINGARAFGINDRVGSIEVGKDADLVIWTGNPLDVRSHVILTMINGKIFYEVSRDGQQY
ncbi:MAG: amidohydrolase family protein [Candidatus Aminicenantaceae bacterium]